MRGGTGLRSTAKRQSTYAAATPASAGNASRKPAGSDAADAGISARELVRVHFTNGAEGEGGEQLADRGQGAGAAEALPQADVARRAGQRARLGIELPRVTVDDRRSDRLLVRAERALDQPIRQKAQQGPAAGVGKI